MKIHPRCFARSRPSIVYIASISPSIPHGAERRGREREPSPLGGISRSGKRGKTHAGSRVCSLLQHNYSTSPLTVHADLTLVFEIALVPNEHHRKVILVLDPEDLLMELVDFLKRFSSGYRVYEDEAFSGAHVLFAHGSACRAVRKVAIEMNRIAFLCVNATLSRMVWLCSLTRILLGRPCPKRQSMRPHHR